MRITIHQPEHLPWLGFFHKINMAEMYVVLDNVQYRRRYVQNRNKIRTKDGWQWITVPLEKENRDDLLIKDAKISDGDRRWKKKSLESIYHNYCKAPYFKIYWRELQNIFDSEYLYLADLNVALIKYFLRMLNINVEIKLASDMSVTGEKGDLIYDICRTVGADVYISGISGRDYLDFNKFNSAGIEIIVQEFHHPIYSQLHDSFFPCMSAIDLLFNHGDKSLGIINGTTVPVMKEIFH